MKGRDQLWLFLDAVQDDAYDPAELWSIARREGVSEEEAREKTRAALLELYRLGYVRFFRKTEIADSHELGAAEIDDLRNDSRAWGMTTNGATTIAVTTTPAGDAALRGDALE